MNLAHMNLDHQHNHKPNQTKYPCLLWIAWIPNLDTWHYWIGRLVLTKYRFHKYLSPTCSIHCCEMIMSRACNVLNVIWIITNNGLRDATMIHHLLDGICTDSVCWRIYGQICRIHLSKISNAIHCIVSLKHFDTLMLLIKLTFAHK